jgi:L-rhamnose mutarotase
MFTLGLAMTLRPGAYAQYKLAHDQLWPELAAGMSANQISMVIYRDGDRLFLFASAPSEAHWHQSRQDPILARWDALMTEFLETNEQGGIAFTVLPIAFGFGDFPPAQE